MRKANILKTFTGASAKRCINQTHRVRARAQLYTTKKSLHPETQPEMLTRMVVLVAGEEDALVPMETNI